VSGQTRTDKSGYVYLLNLEGTNHFKVGVAIDIQRRLYQLSGASPHPIVVIASYKHSKPYVVEKRIHQALQSFNVRREWFQCERHEIDAIFHDCNTQEVPQEDEQSADDSQSDIPPTTSSDMFANFSREELLPIAVASRKLARACDQKNVGLFEYARRVEEATKEFRASVSEAARRNQGRK
jgi:hypothetical protein